MYDSLNGFDVAVKLINFRISPIDSQMMKKEVIALSNLVHQNIVKLIDSFPDNQNQLVVIMEHLRGGELYDYWHRFPNRKMPEYEACEIMLQLA
jgi:serine/threonine protein kinase